MVITTSLICTASAVRIVGVAAAMSIPSSAMAATATGLTSPAGLVPAERTSMRSPAMRLSKAAAICERPALWTQTNRTLGLSAIGYGSSVWVGSEEAGTQREGNVDQPDKHGHFDQWSDAPGQGLPRRGAVGGNRHGDRQFEIVTGGGERERRGAGGAEPRDG